MSIERVCPSPEYKFMFIGKEGKRGFDNDDFEYISPIFDNFEKCYVACVKFNIKTLYPYIRSSKSFILYDPDSTNDNINGMLTPITDGIMELYNCEQQLGLSEQCVDKILDKISEKFKLSRFNEDMDINKCNKKLKIYNSDGTSTIINT